LPGKKGVKLIPRKSKSGKYFSVKALVFSLLEKNVDITKEEVEKVVRKEYPTSNFFGKDGKGGHFAWYKHQFVRKGLEKDFQLKERNNNAVKKEPKEEKPKDTIELKAEAVKSEITEPTKCESESVSTSNTIAQHKGGAGAKPNRSGKVRSRS